MEPIIGVMDRFKYRYDHILVIGNGFDLNLGLPTTYKNFVESRIFEKMYVKRKHEKLEKRITQPSLIDYLYGKMSDTAKQVNAKLVADEKPQPGTILTTLEKASLYNHSYKDPIGETSKSIIVPKGTKVKLVRDCGDGWSKVKYKNKDYWILNGHVSSKLSKHPKVKLKKDRKCRQIVNGKLSKAVTNLKKGTTVMEIAKIKLGEYKDYSYIGIDKKRYYIKNL
jgi:hypothetical protein